MQEYEAGMTDEPDQAGLLYMLGAYGGTQYQGTGEMQALEAAINSAEAAVEATPGDHPDRAGLLSNLANRLSSRYERFGDMQDLGAAINSAEAAVEATPGDHPDRARRLSNLSGHLRRRYQRTRDMHDLEVAIDSAEAAVEATPGDHPDRARRLTNLANSLSSRYERFGDIQYLGAAINATEAAVEATPRDHPDRAGRLSNLAYSLSSRYERFGDMHDLEAAINSAEAAVEATAGDHPDRATMLSNLGSHFSSRYGRSGDMHDLEAAINATEAALEATPGDHPDLEGRLSNLGVYLRRRYQRTGDMHDLETAIHTAEAAVEATPGDHPDRAGLLSNLANRLSSRWERFGDMHDLEAAINSAEAALEATPCDHPDRAGRLGNLANILSRRYQRLGDIHDLEAAINSAEAAVEATPGDHPHRARRLSSLANRLSRRYERFGDMHDLEAAINSAEAAVEATPMDHPDRAGRLSNLGCDLSRRYGRFGDMQDLEVAIKFAEAAVEATPGDHPGRAPLLNILGNHLKQRYSRTGQLQDLELALAAWFACWDIHTGQTLTRIKAALSAAQILVLTYSTTSKHSNVKKACLLLRDAVHRLPLATSRSLEREDQQYILGQLTGLVSLAAAASLEAGQSPLEALRLLELGRSVTNTQLLDYRSDISKLMEQHPILAKDFNSLRQELDSPLPLEPSSKNQRLQILESPLPYMDTLSDMSQNQRRQIQQATISRRNKVAKDLDEMLQKIRQKPGFQTFLRAESEEYMFAAAQEGPIVILNVTELRSDAILLTKERVTSIALPQLSYDVATRYFGRSADNKSPTKMKNLKNALSQLPNPPTIVHLGKAYESQAKMLEWLLKVLLQPLHDVITKNRGPNTEGNEVMRELLEWLWKAAVQPVLRELGFYPKPITPLPRIWWIGVGLMAQAPIHAATKFTKRAVKVKMTTLQYCLPSYTSTIRALQYSRARRFRQCQPNGGSTLIVTMPTTPGNSPLEGATKEADEIQNSLGSFRKVEKFEQPTSQRVLEALSGYSIAHFACHGVSSINPADSHLLLLKASNSDDGSCTEEVDKLHVKDIAALKLPPTGARLAYLSACSTADNISLQLLDEVTHIVSSFHIAGFINVIGTLWPSDDEACYEMAAGFYATLSKTDNVAVSYRTAILEVMKQKPSQPMYWAPFILFGA